MTSSSNLNSQFPPTIALKLWELSYQDESHWVEKVLVSQTGQSPAQDF